MRRVPAAPLKVHRWTGAGTLDAAALRAGASPLVLGIATPDTSIRDCARGLARDALRDALAILLDRPAQQLPLHSCPGQPIRLDLPGPRVGISVSHEPGLSLAAVHPGKAIGIDLMRVAPEPGWMQDWQAVARDYLGPQAAERIARLAQADRPFAFSRAWTRLEAGLKCHDMQLQEWSPELERALARCRLFDLDLPDGFVGTLAVG